MALILTPCITITLTIPITITITITLKMKDLDANDTIHPLEMKCEMSEEMKENLGLGLGLGSGRMICMLEKMKVNRFIYLQVVKERKKRVHASRAKTSSSPNHDLPKSCPLT